MEFSEDEVSTLTIRSIIGGRPVGSVSNITFPDMSTSPPVRRRIKEVMTVVNEFPVIRPASSTSSDSEPIPSMEQPPAADDPYGTILRERIRQAFYIYSSQSAPQPTRECSIYTVPPDIAQFDQEAYKPKVVSIGPYHYNKDYWYMHMGKWRCLSRFLSRHNSREDPVEIIFQCVEKLKGHERRVRGYYSQGNESLDSEDLAALMMLDGFFILHLLLDREREHLAGRIWIWTLVKYDLLLVENQIPFFVLYLLLEVIGIRDNVDLVEKALDYFKDAHPTRMTGFSLLPSEKDQILHLFHLFYMSLLPNNDPSSSSSPPPPPPPASSAPLWIPCATELTDFGFDFKENDQAKSFLDINFNARRARAVITIPSLLIDDQSKNLFRNLIAFEQCYPYTNFHITVYALFMDCIITLEKDVRLLHSNGILVNRMSADQDITQFFSRLCTGINFARDRFYLAKLFEDVNKYKDDRFNKCWGEFKLSYCSNTWVVFAGVVSVIFFILTVLQTFFTIFPYYNPRE